MEAEETVSTIFPIEDSNRSASRCISALRCWAEEQVLLNLGFGFRASLFGQHLFDRLDAARGIADFILAAKRGHLDSLPARHSLQQRDELAEGPGDTEDAQCQREANRSQAHRYGKDQDRANFCGGIVMLLVSLRLGEGLHVVHELKLRGDGILKQTVAFCTHPLRGLGVVFGGCRRGCVFDHGFAGGERFAKLIKAPADFRRPFRKVGLHLVENFDDLGRSVMGCLQQPRVSRIGCFGQKFEGRLPVGLCSARRR